MNLNYRLEASFIRTNAFVRLFDDQDPAVYSVRKTSGLIGQCLLVALLVLPPVSSAQQPVIIDHPLPQSRSNPDGITRGPDGAVWFTEFTSKKIGRITTAGVLTEFPVPSGLPELITVGADGALWFTEFENAKMGRITAAGLITEFTLPTADSHPGLTTGPDGALWFTEDLSNKIARFALNGAVSEFTIPTAECFPNGITTGPDGALWFTEFGANKIGRLTTVGIFSEFSLPTANSGPAGITAAGGALWFTESGANQIGTITTTGVITEFPVPTAFSRPSGIAAGPDTAAWFTEFDGNQIGRIGFSGVFTEYPIPTASSGPSAIKTGPDNALWFTAFDGNFIGQVVIPRVDFTATPDTGVPGTNISLGGSGFSANEVVNFFINSTGMNQFGSASADSAGTLAASTRTPAAPNGYAALVGVGQTSGTVGATTFTMQARLTLSPKTASRGDTVAVSGFGFAAGEAVDVFWKTPRRNLGRATADAKGSLAGTGALNVVVPSNASLGNNVVYAQGQTSTALAFTSIVVQ